MPASTSACTSPSQPIELFVSSSGKATLRPLSWLGWRTKPWIKRLSGVILDPSTASRGVAAFVSSLPVIPASRSAWPAAGEALTTRATYGPLSLASSTRSDPNGCSSRTSRATSIWDWPTSSEILPAWTTRQRSACSRREKRAQAIAGVASSSWPTPTARDSGYQTELLVQGETIKLVAPADIDTESGGQFPVSWSARVWTMLFLILQAMGIPLSAVRPNSSPLARVSFKGGNGSLLSDLRPNPLFYEMLMGWPTSWTAPGASVTEFAAWLQRSRGRFSRLLMDFRPEG